jgi:predicted aspartyl protease
MPRHNAYLAVIWLLFVILAFPQTPGAEFYKYVTKEGDVFYVDDISNIPEEYRNSIKTYKESTDFLSDEERVFAIQKEKQRAEEVAEAERQRKAALQRAKQLNRMETKVVIEGNQILVPVTIGNGILEHQTVLLLDTGASQIVLHRDFANRINLRSLGQNLSRLAGGGTIYTERSVIDYIKVGPYQMKDVGVIVINHVGGPVNYSGLLGMNFLRNVAYSIDYKNQKIRWLDAANTP